MRKKKALVVTGTVVLAAVIGIFSYYFISDVFVESEIQENKDSSVSETDRDVAPASGERQEDSDEKQQVAGDHSPRMPEIKEYDQNVVWKSGNEAAGKKKLKKLHAYYNRLLGWGEADSIYWGELDADDMRNRLQDLHNFVEPSKMKNDLNNAKALMELGLAKNDEMSLRFVHRILHDLDYYVNGTTEDGVWKVTDAFNGDPSIVKHHLLDSEYFVKN